MTAAQPEHAPDGLIQPTPEEIEAFNARRFASPEELVDAWFALFGVKTTCRPYDPANWPGVRG